MPNDAVVHPNGDIWFTDPGYGGLMNYEEVELIPVPFSRIRRKRFIVSIPRAGRFIKLPMIFLSPMGCAFPRLQVSLRGGYRVQSLSGSGKIKVWDVLEESKLANGRVFTSMQLEVGGEMKAGMADGILGGR